METSRVKRKDSPMQYKEKKRGQRKYEEKCLTGKNAYYRQYQATIFLCKLRSYLLPLSMELDQPTPHPGGQCPNILQLHLTDSSKCFPSTLVHPSHCVNILGGFFNNLSRRIHKGAISSQAVKLVEHIAAVLYWGKPQTYGPYKS